MANIRLKRLFEAEDFQAKSKETGKLVHFKSKDSYQAALKAGTHTDPKAKKGDVPKAAGNPNDMFGGDYSKDRGGETPTSNTSHTPVKPDSKEVNIISGFTRMREKFVADFINKHKLDADALSKFVHKGSLRDRMDVGTAMAGNPGNEYEKELIKKFGPKEVTSTSTSPSNMGGEARKANLPKKASQLNYKHASSIADVVNAESGLDGYVDTDDNTDAIMYSGKKTGNAPTYTLYFGANDDYGKPDEFRVSLLSTYGNDPSNIDSLGIDKSFKSGADAMKFMIAVAKKYKKELQMDDDDTNESTKLTSIIKK